MQDILERLRDSSPHEGAHDLQCRCLEAADEIERLRAAIAWALGEGPDSNGKWFEPDTDEPRRTDGNPIARYWWRGNLRRLTAPNV